MRIYKYIWMAAVCLLFTMPGGVLAADKTEASSWELIMSSVSDEASKAKIPAAAVAVIEGDNIEYLYHLAEEAGKESGMHTLFQLGSVSKAYTGLGILLLEDNGLLSLEDPVSKYLPWFTVSFEGKSVPAEEMTIADFLYQTSGFTNDEIKYPDAVDGMSLEESVRQIAGKELMGYPSKQFAYSNVNFRVLGLIIETVSGQRYEEFMEEQILHPLGLYNTYADLSKIEQENIIMDGSRLSFFRTWNYNISAEQGNVPAGYIYSDIEDMSRWLQIQMGKIEVSEQFKKILEKSHQPSPESIVDDNTHYAAGWFIKDKTGEIYHSGGTPNYSANVTIRPESGTAVCVLTNINASANTNNIAANILNILENKPVIPYHADVWMIFDLIFSWVTIIGIIGTLILIYIIVKTARKIRMGERRKIKMTGKSVLLFIPASVLMLLTIIVAVIVPSVFSSSWADIGIWAPLSLLSGMASLIALAVTALGVSFMLAIFKRREIY